MKKLLSIILLLASFGIIVGLSNSNVTYAQETTSNNITVIGCARYEAEPDAKYITILSEIESSNLEELKTTSENTIESFKDYLTTNGINNEDISSCNTFLYQHCVTNEETGSLECNYKIANYITFLTDINTDIEPIITALVELGASENYKERTTIKNIEENYNKALQVAVENAKEKAKNLSDKELKIISIKESIIM